MSKKIFIISEHHTAQALKQILVSHINFDQSGEWIIESEKEGVRSIAEVLNFIAENSGLIFSVIGSVLAAWKLYIDQEKIILEAGKRELDKRRQSLEEDKFRFELMKWQQQKAKLENQIPKTITVQSEVGDELVLPLDLSSLGETKLELEEKLHTVNPENIKGIVFE